MYEPTPRVPSGDDAPFKSRYMITDPLSREAVVLLLQCEKLIQSLDSSKIITSNHSQWNQLIDLERGIDEFKDRYEIDV